MTAILPRRLRVHPCLGRRNLLAFLCLYQRKQPPNLPVCDQSASAPMNRNTLGLIVVGSGTLFVVSQELLLSPVKDYIRRAGWCLVACPRCAAVPGTACTEVDQKRGKRHVIPVHDERRQLATENGFGSVGWHT